MTDLLLAPSTVDVPSVRFASLIHPHTHRNEPNTRCLRQAKSTPQLRRKNDTAIARTFRGIGNLWLSWKDGLSPKEREHVRQREERRQTLFLRMKHADSYEQWEAAAKELDHLEGNDAWKTDESEFDAYYNPKLLAERLRELREARATGDIRLMMHLVRTTLFRDMAGTDNIDLYRHSYIGTKSLIERYVDSTLDIINTIVAQGAYDTSVEYRDLLEGMLFARQSFGRSALLLSGGGTFGMAHIGVVKCLFQAKLLPRIISGASAGSIVAAALCTSTDEELPELMSQFPYGDLAVFEEEENRDGVLGHLRRLLTEGSWSDIKHLTRVMRELTSDLTFQEAYNRTRRILNICVSTASVYEMPRLLNYVTAPNVMIWSAVATSCSVPLVFHAPPLLVKDPLTGEHHPWNPTPQRWIDGSVDNDLPMTRLAEMFNVNHFIVSQVNPHVVPFLDKNDYLVPDAAAEKPKPGASDEINWAIALTTLAKDEALHRLQFLAEIGFFSNLATKLRSVLSQKYSGDITILPEIGLQDLPSLMANPTVDFMLRSCLAGERATWPKLSRIRDRCAIELALDRAVHRLRARVVFSESHEGLGSQRCSIGNLQLHGKQSGFTPEKTRNRPRRQSGGSLLSPAVHRALLDRGGGSERRSDGVQTRPPSRNSRQRSPTPILKRASKSHTQVPTQRRLASPLDAHHGSLFKPYQYITAPMDDTSSMSTNEESSTGTQIETRLKPWMSAKASEGLFLHTPEDADISEPLASSDQGPFDLDTEENGSCGELDDQSRTSPGTQGARTGDETDAS